MEAKEVEKEPLKTTQLQTIKANLKKWWLLPTMVVLITIPMILVLTFPKDKAKANDTTKIVNNIFNYEPLQAIEFTRTVTNYSQIKQVFIASATKDLNIYLTQEEWNSLPPQSLAIENKIVKEKIINNLSNKLRLIGLIEADKTINLDQAEITIDEWNKEGESVEFAGSLRYQNADELLPIEVTLNLTQELIEPLKIINNETMPKLLNELKNNNQLQESIKWNGGNGFWYGLDTIGEKEGENNQWKGLQKIELKNFNDVALAWFLDTLKTTNLIDYNVGFEVENLHFYVDGWNKNNLYLKNKEGLDIIDDYVILTADNFPWNDQTNKAASIVSTIDFGWKNPLNDEITTINSTGSYILGPVWEYYDQE